jgi:hypothetical protein
MHGVLSRRKQSSKSGELLHIKVGLVVRKSDTWGQYRRWLRDFWVRWEKEKELTLAQAPLPVRWALALTRLFVGASRGKAAILAQRTPGRCCGAGFHVIIGLLEWEEEMFRSGLCRQSKRLMYGDNDKSTTIALAGGRGIMRESRLRKHLHRTWTDAFIESYHQQIRYIVLGWVKFLSKWDFIKYRKQNTASTVEALNYLNQEKTKTEKQFIIRVMKTVIKEHPSKRGSRPCLNFFPLEGNIMP